MVSNRARSSQARSTRRPSRSCSGDVDRARAGAWAILKTVLEREARKDRKAFGIEAREPRDVSHRELRRRRSSPASMSAAHFGQGSRISTRRPVCDLCRALGADLVVTRAALVKMNPTDRRCGIGIDRHVDDRCRRMERRRHFRRAVRDRPAVDARASFSSRWRSPACS